MKIHDVEYLLFRTLRRFRGLVFRRNLRPAWFATQSLRLFTLAFLLTSIVRVNSLSEAGNVQKVPPPAGPGIVLSSEAAPLPSPTAYPRRLPESPGLDDPIARSVLVIDASSSATLLEKEPDLKLPIASITKLVTALIVEASTPLEEVVTVPDECTLLKGAQVIGLKGGEEISVKNLLYGLLVGSGADSACALASYQGGSIEEFVERMMDKMREFGLKDTFFVNATGLEINDSVNTSTVGDVLAITRSVLARPVLREIVRTAKITIKSVDGKFSHLLTNTNELLFTLPGMEGVKTGFTEKAGGCLSFYYSGDGYEIMGVVLGSSERGRFEDARRIVNWVKQVYVFP